MKVGDKVICKLSLLTENATIVEKGKGYEILNIDDFQMKIRCYCNNCYFIFGLNLHPNGYQFIDYFHSEKEVRKLKLDNIG